MEGQGEKSHTSYTSAMTLTELGVPHVPNRYILPPSERPNPNATLSNTLPVIDISSIQDPSRRPHIINEIQRALFQVINHGIPFSAMQGALDAATEFFNLPIEEKMVLMSDNVHEPVRYGTSLNQAQDKVHFWRDFIKHYSHPISNWIHPDFLQEEMEAGSQVMTVNCYPACPEPEVALGMPPHSDYGTLTILLQSCPGLQIMDQNKNWLSVPAVDGALIVQLGDQLEVMSNGQYEGVLHRVLVNKEKKRLSIASLHSLPLNMKMGPAPKLVDNQRPVSDKIPKTLLSVSAIRIFPADRRSLSPFLVLATAVLTLFTLSYRTGIK